MTAQAPYYPIVYVRGYAGTRSEVEATTADPYMGFNLGSMKLRQRWTGDIERHVFESPLIRLMKDHGYRDIYTAGSDMPDEADIPERSIWIYRYYEPVSKDLGEGRRREIEDYAQGLHDFIESIRDRLCGTDTGDHEVGQRRSGFRVYLVAHSMGGLIVRSYLQNICRDHEAPVDKVFTYATPHGGIDIRLAGNLPAFLTLNNVDNFNVDRMREYLQLDEDTPVNSLAGRFPVERFFSLVGTNHRDYTVSGGMARRLVGPLSDGLVRIQHATVDKSPRAFVHRSHSGDYGIVNSEEGYQNLARFLFGDIRIEALLKVAEVSLPPRVQKARDEGRRIRASYHIETIGRVRGARWDLHRRLVDEESAIFETYDELVRPDKEIHLFITYLAGWARVRKTRPKLGLSLDLRVLVPEYEIDGSWFADEHYDGGYLFRDKLNLEVSAGNEPLLRYGWDSRTPNRATQSIRAAGDEALREYWIPVRQKSAPGINAELIIRTRPWQ